MLVIFTLVMVKFLNLAEGGFSIRKHKEAQYDTGYSELSNSLVLLLDCDSSYFYKYSQNPD